VVPLPNRVDLAAVPAYSFVPHAAKLARKDGPLKKSGIFTPIYFAGSLPNVNFCLIDFFSVDPFFRIYAKPSTDRKVLMRSEVIPKNLNPSWKPITINARFLLAQICGKSKLMMTV